MSPVNSNTQVGLITRDAESDLSASVGCFATINTSGYAALPSANALALYQIEDAYSTGGVVTPPSATLSGASYKTVLRPLEPGRNIRVVAGATIATPGVEIVTTALGKAVPASTGGYILGIAEEAASTGQYVLIRPLGGIQTKS